MCINKAPSHIESWLRRACQKSTESMFPFLLFGNTYLCGEFRKKI